MAHLKNENSFDKAERKCCPQSGFKPRASVIEVFLRITLIAFISNWKTKWLA